MVGLQARPSIRTRRGQVTPTTLASLSISSYSSFISSSPALQLLPTMITLLSRSSKCPDGAEKRREQMKGEIVTWMIVLRCNTTNDLKPQIMCSVNVVTCSDRPTESSQPELHFCDLRGAFKQLLANCFFFLLFVFGPHQIADIVESWWPACAHSGAFSSWRDRFFLQESVETKKGAIKGKDRDVSHFSRIHWKQ